MSKTSGLICLAIYLSSSFPAFAEDSVGTNFILEHMACDSLKMPTKSAKQHIAQREATANTLSVPNPILTTGSDIRSEGLSPNAVALAEQLRICDQLATLSGGSADSSSKSIGDRLDYFEKREHVSEVLRGAEMDVNYTLAEIYNEEATYNELLGTFGAERDKIIAKTNAVSFGTNGALWALCEAMAIPTATRSSYVLPSAITGVLAGIIPSIASALTLKQVNGKKHSVPAAPNMLSGMFGRTTSNELDYPPVVSTFLRSSPADSPNKTRKDLIIDRWIMDSNIPVLTDRRSKEQIDAVTAVSDKRNSITISLLSARVSMLQQLASEIFKMNRLLDELEMALRGAKHFDTAVASSPRSVEQ